MTTLTDLDGSRWSGTSELFLDALGNVAVTSACSISCERDAVTYLWTHKGEQQRGKVVLRADGVDFSDTFHSPQPMVCASAADGVCLLAVFGTYGAGDGPPWGWRISLSLRPSDELVLQMTNVAPWGEDARAVRMVCKRLAH